jgi:hypothetical protein
MLVLAFGATAFALLNWMPRGIGDRATEMQGNKGTSGKETGTRETSTQVNTYTTEHV